jgi:hypothetical protein
MSAPSAVALPAAKADAFPSAQPEIQACEPSPASVNGFAGPDLYERVVEAVRLWDDARWVTESFQGDCAAAARFLENGPLADAWDGFQLSFDDLRRVLRRFPDPAEWTRYPDSPRRLWEQLCREGEADRRRFEREGEEAHRQAARQACDQCMDRHLRDPLLLCIRGGAWHAAEGVTEPRNSLIPNLIAMRRFRLEHPADRENTARVQAIGRRLLWADTIALLQGLKLLEVRNEAGRQEIRSTPWEDPHFEVDERLAHNLPRSPEQARALEELLVREGCRDELVVWRQKKKLVDGHFRYGLMSLLGRPYRVREQDFADEQEVDAWQWETHYGRRNFTEVMNSYYRGKCYLALKGERGGDHKSRRSKSKSSTLIHAAEMLAERHRLDRATIYNDARFTTALDQLAEMCGRPIRDWILTQGGHGSAGKVRKLLRLPPDEMRRIVEAILATGAWPKARLTAWRGKPSSPTLRPPPGGWRIRALATLAKYGPEQTIRFRDALSEVIHEAGQLEGSE